MLSCNVTDISPFHVMEILEKAQQMEKEGRHIIHLEVGEPDFPTPSNICEAAIDAMHNGETKYTHSQGIFALREAIANNYNNKFSLNIIPEQIIVTSGTSPALLLVFMSLLEKNDEVILSNPYYACYPNFIKLLGAKPYFIFTKKEQGFSLEPQEVEKHITSKTKAILINSPCNPTGYVMSNLQLSKLAHIAGDIPIISDEIYQGLIYEGEDHTILEYTNNAFVLNGFSKLYSMTGWRLGYLIMPIPYVRTLQKMQQNFFISTNAFVQYGGITALKESNNEVEKMRKIYDERRLYMINRIKGLGLKIYTQPVGAFYILADASHYNSNSLELSHSILDKTGVAVTPGIDFGIAAEGYLRFSYANSIKNIELAMNRLEEYFKK